VKDKYLTRQQGREVSNPAALPYKRREEEKLTPYVIDTATTLSKIQLNLGDKGHNYNISFLNIE